MIVGSEKMLVYEDGSSEPVRVFDSGIEYKDPETFGEYQLSYRTGEIVSLRVDAKEPIVAELEDFFGRARRHTSPTAPEVAIDVIEVVEAAEASLSARTHVSDLGDHRRPRGRDADQGVRGQTADVDDRGHPRGCRRRTRHRRPDPGVSYPRNGGDATGSSRALLMADLLGLLPRSFLPR